MARPFRFGVVVATVHDARSWRSRCGEVEDLGYSTLYLPDSSAPQMAPVAALAVAAAVTTTLRVGMLVANNDMRNPVVLARELATLDVLSDGRVEWGMGAGWFPPDYEVTGIALDRPGVRVTRLVDAVERMRAVFGAPDGTAGSPVPVQAPHPPLLVGAAERRLLTYAGREADIVNVNRSFATVGFGGRPPRKTPAGALVDQIGWVREGAGERFGAIEIGLEVNPPVVVTSNRDGALSRLAARAGVEADLLADDPRTWVGSVDSIVEALHRHREQHGVSHWVVYEQHLRDIAPVVAALAGR